MSPVFEDHDRGRARFPRVSGDEPHERTEARSHDWFSPRERG